MSDELKPCPFCGGKARLDESPISSKADLGSLWDAICTNEICCVSLVENSEAEAIAAWNRRVPAQGAGVQMPPEIRAAIAKSLDNSIGDITAHYQMAWSLSDEQDDGEMLAMRNDRDLNALIDAKRWIEAQAQAQEQEAKI